MTDGDFEDFSDLFDLESEFVEVGKHKLRVDPLTTADIRRARQAVQLKQITMDDSENFFAWLAIKKSNPGIKWKDFNEKWLPRYKNVVMAKVIQMNGFLELRDAIDGTAPNESEPEELDLLD